MRSLISMVIMTILWWRRQVTFYQKGKVVAIGRIRHISDHWIVIKDAKTAEGEIRQMACSRNRIDLFWVTREDDYKRLQSFQTSQTQEGTAGGDGESEDEE